MDFPSSRQTRADTVSEFVSQKGGGVAANNGELRQIMVDFIGVFAILLASDSMQQTVFLCG